MSVGDPSPTQPAGPTRSSASKLGRILNLNSHSFSWSASKYLFCSSIDNLRIHVLNYNNNNNNVFNF